ncbi:MAG: VWA domain-containing protein, partial [Gemmatimonadaceae bacterium]
AVGAAKWWRSVVRTPEIPLSAIRRRLELLLAATYGAQFEIAALPRENSSTMWGTRKPGTVARFQDMVIELPESLPAASGSDAAIARFRLLAIEQAARIVRGSCAHAPGENESIAADLFNLCESAQIDASIARESPPLVVLLVEERKRAMVQRRAHGRLSAQERAVERLISTVLESSPADLPRDLATATSPKASLEWARAAAATITALRGSYRSRPPVAIWGATMSRVEEKGRAGLPQGSMIPPSPGCGSGQSTLPYGGDENGPQEPSSIGSAAYSAGDERDTDAEDGTDLLKDETREGRAETSDEGAGGKTMPGAGNLNQLDAEIVAAWRSDGGVLYPEWDCNASKYRELGAVVRRVIAAEGDASWSEHQLEEHPALVRRVRDEFERLRARRTRLLRQRDGEELDLDACVRALADAATGDASNDRLYAAVRAARRAIAITLLVDVSGSTKDEVTPGRRVIDVEKTTLLLASEAFDALGDSYSIQTFASGGAADVRVATLKEFRESNSESVRRRIAGIAAGGNTRLGAAIRHACATLSAQPAGHRLLLILSDGKPNDVDRYFTTYAIEDSRQAVFEARAAGIYPYCLTIDSHDPDPYLARVFGSAGHTILRRPEQLPVALLDLVRMLLRGGPGI